MHTISTISIPFSGVSAQTAEKETERKNKLVLDHMLLAEKVARSMKKHFYRFMTLEEMISEANFALVDAAERYNPSSENTFVTFSYRRIRGAIIDAAKKKIAETHHDVQVAQSPFSAKSAFEPERRAMREELKAFVQRALTNAPLKDRERQALELYYLHEIETPEIGIITGVKKSRVSQILTDARHKVLDYILTHEKDGLSFSSSPLAEDFLKAHHARRELEQYKISKAIERLRAKECSVRTANFTLSHPVPVSNTQPTTTLSPREYTILRFFYVDEQSSGHIQQNLRINKSGVSSSKHYGLKKLERCGVNISSPEEIKRHIIALPPPANSIMNSQSLSM